VDLPGRRRVIHAETLKPSQERPPRVHLILVLWPAPHHAVKTWGCSRSFGYEPTLATDRSPVPNIITTHHIASRFRESINPYLYHTLSEWLPTVGWCGSYLNREMDPGHLGRPFTFPKLILFSCILFSCILFSCILFSCILFSCILFSCILFSCILFSCILLTYIHPISSYTSHIYTTHGPAPIADLVLFLDRARLRTLSKRRYDSDYSTHTDRRCDRRGRHHLDHTCFVSLCVPSRV
jgi:hypothetical protein